MSGQRFRAALARLFDDLAQQRSVALGIISKKAGQVDRMVGNFGSQRQRRELRGRVYLLFADLEESPAFAECRETLRDERAR